MPLPHQIIFALAAFGALISAADAKAANPIRHHHAVRHVRHHVAHCSHRHPCAVREGSPVVDTGENAGIYWARDRHGQPGPVEAAGGDLVATARRFLGTGRQRGMPTEWCGAFMGLVARVTGDAVPSGYLQAAQWIHAGPRLPGPRPGAYAVRAHHIALVEAVEGRFVKLINGNFRNRVAESIEPASRFFAYVAPVRR